MIPRYVVNVFSQSLCEQVAAFGIGHEVKKVNTRGMERRAQRSFAGIGDGARRESRVTVCIIRRIHAQIRKRDRSLVEACFFQRVNYCWIAAKRHSTM